MGSSRSTTRKRKHKDENHHNYSMLCLQVSVGIIIGYMAHYMLDGIHWFRPKEKEKEALSVQQEKQMIFSKSCNNLFQRQSMPSRRNLLLISNESHTAYHRIKECLDEEKIDKVLLIPFGHDDYEVHSKHIEQKMWEIGKECVSIHKKYKKMRKLIKECDAILIVGGNSYSLLYFLYHYNLVFILQKIINGGTLFIGIGAGANIASMSIQTCFDIPLIEPQSFRCLAVIPFQLVSHFNSIYNEIYEHQLRAFLKQSGLSLLGLSTDSALRIKGNGIRLTGLDEAAAILFRNCHDKMEQIAPNGLLTSIMFPPSSHIE